MSERTSAEVRRAIAARLGYTKIAYGGKVGWLNGERVSIPDWPRDTDAALALCVSIAKERQWRVTVDYTEMPGIVHFECFYAIGGIDAEISQPIDPSLDHPEADALARLALAALEQGRG